MRVLIDTTFALRGPSGTGVYLERLCGALRGLGVEVVEAGNVARRAPAGGGWRSVLNLAADEAWQQVGLPRAARRSGAQLVHHPLPAASYVDTVPQVVTVHDLAFERLPGCFDPRFRAWAHVAHRAAARRAAVVVCPSRATARDGVELWGLDPDRIVVAPHGPGQEPEAVAWSANREGADHFLYVGDDEPRKDLGVLRAAYARYRRTEADPLELVLAGSIGPAGRGDGAPGVRVVQRPDAEALAALHLGAAALVHPSRHEGFGLTPLEAMTAGTPVLAARTPAVEETCADAAVYVAPGDAAALAAGLRRLHHEPALRRDLAERGRRRAAEFSWGRSARRHVEAYARALGA